MSVPTRVGILFILLWSSAVLAQNKGFLSNTARSALPTEGDLPPQFQGDNEIIGHSAGGFPILQNPDGDIIYPVLSTEEKSDVVRWIKLHEDFQGAIIREVDEDGWPIFETPKGDRIYLDVRKNTNKTPEPSPVKVLPNPDPAFQTLGKIDLRDQSLEPRPPPFSDKLNATSGTLYSDTCFIPDNHNRCAPHFLIVGAMKSGTTSLFSYLHNHPNILPLVPNAMLNGKPVVANKEVRFFNEPTFSSLVIKHGQEVALREYMKVFPNISPGSLDITGESSPMYICQPDMAKRINLMFPYIKNIMLLRNPIDRMYSEHWFKLSLLHGNEVPASMIEEQATLFEECSLQEIAIYQKCGLTEAMELSEDADLTLVRDALREVEGCYLKTARLLKRISPQDSRCNDPENAFYGLCKPAMSGPTAIRPFPLNCNDHGLRNSLYALQVYEWVEEFTEDRLLILPSEEFYHNTADVVSRVVEFLGVKEREPFDWSFISDKGAYNIERASSARGLSIGGQGVDALKEKYPPIRPEFRRELEQVLGPMNDILYRLIRQAPFWNYNQ